MLEHSLTHSSARNQCQNVAYRSEWTILQYPLFCSSFGWVWNLLFAKMATWVCLDHRHSQSANESFNREKFVLLTTYEQILNAEILQLSLLSELRLATWHFDRFSVGSRRIASLQFVSNDYSFGRTVACNVYCTKYSVSFKHCIDGKIGISNAMSWHQIILNALSTSSQLKFDLISPNIFAFTST